ncbi:MAG TPA: mechanosensitive ion channel family protein [Paludibacter sp.]|nr:mechanosensitive ion channel family protein [Paludibacter sp.]
MLEQTFYGNTVYNWLVSIGIIVGALVLNKIIVLLNKHVIHRLTSKTKNRLDDILFQMLEAPVLLGIALIAIWIAADRLHLPKSFETFVHKAYQLLTVLNVTWFAVRLVNALIEEYLLPIANDPNNKRIDSNILPIIRRSLLGAIWSIGAVMALNNMGVNVETLIASLGIGGLAFALAAQDTIKNIFGGITIFTDRPFRIGDRIIVNNYDGIVEDIGIRSIRLRTLERKLVIIPNYKIVDSFIENVSAEPMRRVLSKIGLTYSTTPAQMNEALQIMKNMPAKVKGIDKEINAFFSEFGDYSMDITFIYYIKKDSEIPKTISEVNIELLRAFNETGLEFAFPTQTIHIGNETPTK